MTPTISRRALSGICTLAALAIPCAVAAANDTRPMAQQRFESYVHSTYWTWRRLESNAIRRGELLGDRARDLRDAMRDQNAFKDWQLAVVFVGLDPEGHAYIVLTSIEKTTPRTILTNISSTQDDRLGQRFPMGSPIYRAAAELVKGDIVVVSGEFFPDVDDGYRELGRVLDRPMEDRMRFPQFCVRYTDLRKR